MLNIFGRSALTADEFARRVFEFLAHRIDGPIPNAGDIQGVVHQLETSPADMAEPERARLYLLCEHYLAEDMPTRRTPRETLRADIYVHCHADQAEGTFALLFYPASRRLRRLAELLTELIIDNSRDILSIDALEEKLRTIDARLEPGDGVKYDWAKLEKNFDRPTTHKKNEDEDRVVSLLRTFMLQLQAAITEENGSLRAEIAIKNAYDTYIKDFGFIEEAPQVLVIIPEDLLAEDRIANLPKTELAEQLRHHSHDLDAALGELREEKRKLSEALAKLHQADEAKNDFITVVSHHFRTPLSAIRWNTETLIELANKLPAAADTDVLRENLRVLEDKTRYLIATLDDIFDLLAIDGRTLTLDRKPNHLWEIASDATKEMMSEADRRGIQLTYEHGPAPREDFSLDREKIRRVLTILIGNAIRYTPAGGNVTVRVAETKLGDRHAIGATIEDTGIGFVPGESLKLFTKFYRGANATKMVTEGAGLGLYLAKHIIEAHSGRIEAEPGKGGGAVFRFAIPKA